MKSGATEQVAVLMACTSRSRTSDPCPRRLVFFLGGVLGVGDTSRAAGGLTLLAFGTTGTASGTDGTDGCDPAFGRVDGG